MSGNSNHGGEIGSGVRIRSQENELRRVLQVLRRRAIPMALTVLIVAAAALGLSLLQDKQYSASASILFRSQSLAQELPGSTAPSIDQQAQAATNLELASLDQIAERTARDLDSGFTAREISESVDVVAKGDSNVIDVTATWGSPRTASRLATAFAQQFVHFQARAGRVRIGAAQKRLLLTLEREREAPVPNQARIRTIEGSLDALQVLKSVDTGHAQLIQRAEVPASPSSPKPVRNGLIGVFGGLLLAIGLAVALEQLDRRVRDSGDLEELLGVPLLAQVPASDGFVAGTIAPIPPPPIEAEIFHILSTTVQRLHQVDGVHSDGEDPDREGPVRSVLVTGPTAGVGKTTVAFNLAVAAARSGVRTLFLEVDLRRPITAIRLGLSSQQSLVDALTEKLPLSEVVQSVPVRSSETSELDKVSLDVVVAGPPRREVARLVESEEMARLIGEAEQDYDLVIVDAPPAGLLSDAIPLLSLVGGAIVVCRIGQTRRDDVLWLRSQLEQVGANVLGVVANFAALRVDRYYGAYRWPTAPDTLPASRANGQQQRTKDPVA